MFATTTPISTSCSSSRMLQRTTAMAAASRRAATSAAHVARRPLLARGRRAVTVRAYIDDDNDDVRQQQLKQQEQQQQQRLGGSTVTTTATKLSPAQLAEVLTVEPGRVSPRLAEMRADMGRAATISALQAFDGPIAETVNGRAAMLGVMVGLLAEAQTGLGLQQQVADHPITVALSAVLLTLATYAPVLQGFTRKEPVENKFLGLSWSAKAENWNGRLAMLGFTAMILTEAIAGVNTLQAWGLQPVVAHVGAAAARGAGMM